MTLPPALPAPIANSLSVFDITHHNAALSADPGLRLDWKPDDRAMRTFEHVRILRLLLRAAPRRRAALHIRSVSALQGNGCLCSLK
jgi:hypothetical protein